MNPDFVRSGRPKPSDKKPRKNPWPAFVLPKGLRVTAKTFRFRPSWRSDDLRTACRPSGGKAGSLPRQNEKASPIISK